MKKNLSIILFLFLFLFTSPSFSMMVGETELIFRAQDDNTIGGLRLSLKIPKIIQDGPSDGNIEVVETDSRKRAIVDNDGNFLNYLVDIKGNIAPRLELQSFSFNNNSKWPPKKASVLVKIGRAIEHESLYVKKYNNIFYIEIDDNFTSQDLDQKMLSQNNIPLEVVDARGERLFQKKVNEMPFFDAVSVFGTVFSVFDMYENDINSIGNKDAIIRFYNFRTKEKIRVFPHVTKQMFNDLYPGEKYEDYEANAFYHYRENDSKGKHVLLFFPVVFGGSKYTSESSDIVSHETGHAALSILRPDLWQSNSNEISAFHETFGDMTALFTVLKFPELRERILEKTKGNLHISSFLSVIGEKIVDRDASQCTTLSLVPSCEEHALSERLTKALYETLADVFNIKHINCKNSDLDLILLNTTNEFRKLFLSTAINIKFSNFIEFGKAMRSTEDALFGNFLHANFMRQGIDLTSPLSYPQICIPRKNEEKSKSVRCSTNQKNSILRYGDSPSFSETSSDYFSLSSSINNKATTRKTYGRGGFY